MKKTISLLCALFMVFSSVSVPVKAEEEIETEKPVEEVQEIEEQEQKETEEEAQATSDETEGGSESEVIPEETEQQEEVVSEEESVGEISEEEVGEDAELLNGTYGDLTYEISDGKVTITDCDQSATSVDIPATLEGYPVTSIGDSAFYNCSILTSITIPDSVTSIGYNTFAGCTGLKSAGPIGGGYDYEFGWKTTIPNFAFRRCSSLTSIMIPDCVTSIGDYAFEYAGIEKITIPESVVKIGYHAFQNCGNLTSIIVPANVTEIGEFVFSGCTGLKSAGPIGGNYDYQFGWKETIPNSAFDCCNGLVSVTIPDTITSIGKRAFVGTKISEISLPNHVNNIGEFAFLNCRNLKEIVLPSDLTSIEAGLFQRCINLTALTIPLSVKSIGTWIFLSCTILQTIDYLGSSDDWQKININSNNEELFNKNIIYHDVHGRDSPGAVFVASLSRLQALYKSLQKPSFISVFLNQGFAQEVGVLYKSLHQPYKSLRQIDELLGEPFLLHCRPFLLHFSKMRNNEAASVFFIVKKCKTMKQCTPGTPKFSHSMKKARSLSRLL